MLEINLNVAFTFMPPFGCAQIRQLRGSGTIGTICPQLVGRTNSLMMDRHPRDAVVMQAPLDLTLTQYLVDSWIRNQPILDFYSI